MVSKTTHVVSREEVRGLITDFFQKNGYEVTEVTYAINDFELLNFTVVTEEHSSGVPDEYRKGESDVEGS